MRATEALEAHYQATYAPLIAVIEAPGHDPEGRWVREDQATLTVAATFREAIDIARRAES